MTVEDKLRAAMHAEVDGLDLDSQAWQRVQTDVRRTRVVRRTGASLVAAAATIAAIVGLRVWVRDDAGDRVVVVPPASTPTTAPGVVEGDAFPGIWPFTSQDDVDAYAAKVDIGLFNDADATALEFARVYLGMPDPTLVEPRGVGEGDTRFVHLTPTPGSPLVTTVWVHRFADHGAYSVTDVVTDNIELDEPQSMHVVGSDIGLTGRSSAFEAQVDVEVRQDGQVFGEHVGETFVMGGAGPGLQPFSGRVTIDPPTKAAGAVVLTTRSAEDGSVQAARVIRVRFSETRAPADTTTFSVFFHRGEELVAVERTVEPTKEVLRAALEALVAGPTAEEIDDGIGSLYSADTARVIGGVNLRKDGTAIVDLADTVPNGSTSGGGSFLQELDATAFQFEKVERIEYRLQGSCEAFWTWLQGEGCTIVRRGS